MPRTLRRLLPAALAFLLVAAACLHGLGRTPLWSDEADTGNEARGILRTGLPTAFDGRNLSLFDDGSQLNRAFLSKKIPWLQYYLGAASLAAFGDSTRGLRTGFALCGLLAFLPLYGLLRRQVRRPALATALILLAPQVILLQRNARYYSLLILLYAALLWLLETEPAGGAEEAGDPLRSGIRLAALSTVLFLLFQTQPFAAACAAGSLLAYGWIWRRARIKGYALASLAGFAPWLLWYLSLGPALAPTGTTLEEAGKYFGGWLWVTGDGLAGTAIDFDMVGCLPLLAGALLVAAACLKRRRDLLRRPLFGLVAINLAAQTMATAALLGFETAGRFAILRYMPHLLVFSLAALLVMLEELVASAALWGLASLALVGTNLGTLCFWAHPWSRRPPVSWVPPVYGEILHPADTALPDALARLRAAGDPGRPQVLFVSPAWTQDVAIFYLGDRYVVSPQFGSASAPSIPWAVRAMGVEAFRRAVGPPDWILDIGHFFTVPPGYRLVAVFPSRLIRPDEGARPELTRHAFAQDRPVNTVRLFRRFP